MHRDLNRFAQHLRRFFENRLWMVVLVSTILLAPTIVDYNRMTPAWDDSYFLTSTLCVRNAVYGLNGAAFYDCFAQVSKSPIIVLMGLPWGSISDPEIVLRTAFVSLSVMTFAVAIGCLIILLRIGASLLGLSLATLCLITNTFMYSFGGSYLVDGLFSFIVALVLLLIPLEVKIPARTVRESIARGALWGGVVLLGILAKVTFGLFMALIGPVLIYLRWKAAGPRAVLITLISAVIMLLPGIAMYSVFGASYFSHAIQASFGGIAHFYSVDGMGPPQYLEQYAAFLGWGGAALAALILLAVFVYARRTTRPSPWLLYPVLITLAYFAITAMSPNQDFRFSMPIMIGLPMVLAALTARNERDLGSLMTPALIALLSGVLASVPMMARVDLHAVGTAGTILKNLAEDSHKPASVLIGSDAGHFSIETLRLAQQMEISKVGNLQVGALVYDYVSGRTLEQSLERLDKADYILLQIDPQGAPEFSNHYLKEYREHVIAVGDKIEADPSHTVDIFRIRHPK